MMERVFPMFLDVRDGEISKNIFSNMFGHFLNYFMLQRIREPKSRIMVGDISNNPKKHENQGSWGFDPSKLDLTSAQ